MNWAQIAAAVAAVAVGLWPQLKVIPKVGPTYQEAIANLALVRARLLATENLADEQKKAIDALTLALVAGSDK
jgi:hypothetical protein